MKKYLMALMNMDRSIMESFQIMVGHTIAVWRDIKVDTILQYDFTSFMAVLIIYPFIDGMNMDG